MATKNKKTVPKKSKSSKAAPKKKSFPAKVSSKATSVPAGYEHKLAEQALKFVDEAASLLRGGIREGAATTAKSRIAAKKKAHDLLGRASSNLSKAIEDGTSVVQNLLKKI
jgi:hypothetical protein